MTAEAAEPQTLVVERATAAQTHLPFVDGLRAAAALFVLLCHAYYEPANGYHSARWLTRIGLTYGHIAVDVFIVVSGFCLMLPIARRGGHVRSWKEFYLRRVRRIFPAYYACLAASLLFVWLFASRPTGTVWDNSLPVTWSAVWSHVLMVHNLPIGGENLSGRINFPLWSIATEVQLYLLMPLMALSFRRWGTAWTVVVAIGAGQALNLATGGRLVAACVWYIGLFAMGSAAARACAAPGFTASRALRMAMASLWTFVAAFILFAGKRRFNDLAPYVDTVVGAATALLLLIAYADTPDRRGFLVRALSARPLVFVGAFSYSLYLIHAPLLHALNLGLSRFLSPSIDAMTGLLLLCSPVILFAAFWFYRAFERPYLRSRAGADKG